ncbi:MAG TPA: DEAD/DEAH box helicase [Bacteroidales bacterium]|nr:DEAD/DEAH box helicase [Bacteroidales bacterium]HOH84973.1 DEAD/DEAH box helicase [Bacteroidales bacterium]
MQFSSLQLIDPLLRSLEQEGYTVPTPIQQEAIPIVLKGKDLLGCAQTGTGKTAAYAVPILQLLHEAKNYDRKRKIKSLIVTPTRELAIQINDSFIAYGRHTGLKSAVVFGGVNQNPQTTALKHGTDILVATPGRLLDLMNQGFISLRDVQIFVLDEADRMLDMGFIHDVRKIIAALPQKRQTLFFSATMPPEIIKLSKSILNQPARVEVTPSASTVDIVKQFVYFIDKGNKTSLLVDLLKDTHIKTALVFTRTKYGADKVVRVLAKNKIKAEAIHSNKSQHARQKALTNFKEQNTRVLVATDIASRGIDVEAMECVINFEISNMPETYVHRIGRTGRAGAGGTAISFCDAEEKKYLHDIEKLIGKKIPVIEGHPYPLVDLHPVKPPKQVRTLPTNPQRNYSRQMPDKKKLSGNISKWG